MCSVHSTCFIPRTILHCCEIGSGARNCAYSYVYLYIILYVCAIAVPIVYRPWWAGKSVCGTYHPKYKYFFLWQIIILCIIYYIGTRRDIVVLNNTYDEISVRMYVCIYRIFYCYPWLCPFPSTRWTASWSRPICFLLLLCRRSRAANTRRKKCVSRLLQKHFRQMYIMCTRNLARHKTDCQNALYTYI